MIPLCLGIIVGRWGCLFAGLADQTFGVPTGLPWGVDLGDGVPRHPVQIYESLARKGETMTTAAMATYGYDQIDQAQTELNAVSK